MYKYKKILKELSSYKMGTIVAVQELETYDYVFFTDLSNAGIVMHNRKHGNCLIIDQIPSYKTTTWQMIKDLRLDYRQLFLKRKQFFIDHPDVEPIGLFTKIVLFAEERKVFTLEDLIEKYNNLKYQETALKRYLYSLSAIGALKKEGNTYEIQESIHDLYRFKDVTDILYPKKDKASEELKELAKKAGLIK